jgi:hypothetical protein
MTALLLVLALGVIGALYVALVGGDQLDSTLARWRWLHEDHTEPESEDRP